MRNLLAPRLLRSIASLLLTSTPPRLWPEGGRRKTQPHLPLYWRLTRWCQETYLERSATQLSASCLRRCCSRCAACVLAIVVKSLMSSPGW